jgi:hypothetical protein
MPDGGVGSPFWRRGRLQNNHPKNKMYRGRQCGVNEIGAAPFFCNAGKGVRIPGIRCFSSLIPGSGNRFRKESSNFHTHVLVMLSPNPLDGRSWLVMLSPSTSPDLAEI